MRCGVLSGPPAVGLRRRARAGRCVRFITVGVITGAVSRSVKPRPGVIFGTYPPNWIIRVSTRTVKEGRMFFASGGSTSTTLPWFVARAVGEGRRMRLRGSPHCCGGRSRHRSDQGDCGRGRLGFGAVVERVRRQTPDSSKAPAVVEASIAEDVSTVRGTSAASVVSPRPAGFVDSPAHGCSLRDISRGATSPYGTVAGPRPRAGAGRRRCEHDRLRRASATARNCRAKSGTCRWCPMGVGARAATLPPAPSVSRR